MNALPGYWQDEESGVLRPVVESYLNGAPLSPLQIGVMRAYLRQWMHAPAWRSLPSEPGGVAQLRRDVEAISDRASLAGWLERALALGIDPL